MSDLFISHTFVGSISWGPAWSLELNNFGVSVNATLGSSCIACFDWDVEKFVETFGGFSKFGGTAEWSSTSWQSCQAANIILYKKEGDTFKEIENKSLGQVGANGNASVPFLMDVNEASLIRFQLNGWCTNNGIPKALGYWKNLYIEE